jgi:trk system potassium uptake protein TrkH
VLHARVRDTAIALFRIYLGLSLAELVLLLACGLDLFDALTHTFSTVSTGGFSPHSESVGGFSPAVQLVITLFMLAAGVNFSLYWMTLRSRSLVAFRDVELRCYLGLILAATFFIGLDLWEVADEPIATALLEALFQAVSILTTTGFATVDFAQWPTVARAMLIGLMIVGGCAGSTAGGVKIVRAIIAWKAANREVRLTFSPNSVISVVVGRSAVPEESVRSVIALLVLWILAWGLGSVLLSIGETDMVTAATASIATLSNIGPGLASVGPVGEFSFFADWQKLLMVLLMWLGRLEFFALLALFQPQFWRR